MAKWLTWLETGFQLCGTVTVGQLSLATVTALQVAKVPPANDANANC